MKSVNLIENFVTWQGEGPDSGRRMVLLRFKYCNKSCVWCDTKLKMRITAESKHTLEDIQTSIYENKAGILITGGEPTFDRHYDDCLTLLNELVYPIANVETNGYKLDRLILETDIKKPVRYIYSPKIFNETDFEIALDIVHRVVIYNDNVIIKLVYDGNRFMENFMSAISDTFSLSSRSQFTSSDKVWLMPEGATMEELIKNSGRVFDLCEKYNYNFSSRNHIIYGFV